MSLKRVDWPKVGHTRAVAEPVSAKHGQSSPPSPSLPLRPSSVLLSSVLGPSRPPVLPPVSSLSVPPSFRPSFLPPLLPLSSSSTESIGWWHGCRDPILDMTLQLSMKGNVCLLPYVKWQASAHHTRFCIANALATDPCAGMQSYLGSSSRLKDEPSHRHHRCFFLHKVRHRAPTESQTLGSSLRAPTFSIRMCLPNPPSPLNPEHPLATQ